jgi:hypothetical protein
MPFGHILVWDHIHWKKHVSVMNGYYISQDASAVPDSLSNSNISTIEPLPGLEAIFEELLQEDGYEFIIAWLMKSYFWSLAIIWVKPFYFFVMLNEVSYFNRSFVYLIFIVDTLNFWYIPIHVYLKIDVLLQSP